MKITYIGHSGFLIECDSVNLLFDYYEGSIPKIEYDKKLIVFVSHFHHDHFNKGIFNLFKTHPNVSYVFSSDVKTTHEIDVVVSENEKVLFENCDIQTYKSTDSGVAFLVKVENETIYHAGDLNLWLWNEETKEDNQSMQENYSKEIDKLKDIKIDIAFLPLDPRQEEYEFSGIEEFVSKIEVDTIFPMHFWNDYSIIERYNANHEHKVVDIKRKGQQFKL
ncbi:MAG: MBL fold metallo-hydrolase [Anaerorhabdus sp.]